MLCNNQINFFNLINYKYCIFMLCLIDERKIEERKTIENKRK